MSFIKAINWRRTYGGVSMNQRECPIHILFIMVGIAISCLLPVDWSNNAVSQDAKTEIGAVRFSRDIAPVLQKNCVSCHRKGQSEGGLSLEDAASMMQGGDSGPLFSKDRPLQSLLIERITDDDDPMPPDDNSVGARRLSQQELASIRQWLTSGAKFDAVGQVRQMKWHSIPETIRCSYTIAVSPDGRLVAVARANRVELLDASTGAKLQDLVDPSLDPKSVADVDFIQSMAFSPLGDALAVGGFRSVKIWRRKPVQSSLPAFLNHATSHVTASPDRDSFAFVNAIGNIEIVERSTGKTRIEIPCESDVRDLDWSEKQTLIVGDADGYVRRVNTTDGSEISQHDVGGPVADVAQHVSGSLFAVRHASGSVRIVQADGLAKLDVIDSIDDAMSIAWLTDEVLAIGHRTGKVTEFNTAKQETARTTDTGSPVVAIEFDSQTKTLAVAGQDGGTRLFRSDTGTLLHTLRSSSEPQMRLAMIDRQHEYEKALVNRLNSRSKELQELLGKEDASLKKATDAKQKATEELSAERSKLDENLKQVAETEQKIAAAKAAIAEAEKAIATQMAVLEKQRESHEKLKSAVESKEKTLTIRDQALATVQQTRNRAAAKIPSHAQLIQNAKNRVSDIEQRRSTIEEQLSSDPIRSLAFSPDQRTIASVHASGVVKTFDRSTGRSLGRFQVGHGAGRFGRVSAVFIEHHQIAIEDGVNPMVTIGTQWDWELERTLGGADSDLIADRVTALDYHHSGRMLAIGSGIPSRGGQVLVMFPDTSQVLRRYDDLHSDTVLALRFSPNGKTLATSSADKTIRLVDVQSAKTQRTLDGHTHHVLGVCWTRDGQRLASASADQTIKIWDTQTGQQQRTITGFPDEVTAVSFLPGTSHLASSCTDGLVRIHDWRNGALQRSSSSGDFLYTLQLTPDAKQILAAGQEGTVHRWQTSDVKLVGQWK